MTEKDFYDLATEMGKHNKLFKPVLNPNLGVALIGLLETFLILRLKSKNG